MQNLADMLDHAFRAVDGGHNGIAVDPADDVLRVDVDLWWRGSGGEARVAAIYCAGS